MKKSLIVFAILGLLTILAVGCGSANTGNSPSTVHTASTVHMDETQFVQSQVTIHKGESVDLVDDAAVVHIIQNGTWDSTGNAKPVAEAGAPKVQLQFNGDDSNTLGPFNTAGTFQFYCTVHQNMNLTVIVK